MRDGRAVLAADVGGTFTDLVAWDGKRITTGKTASTTDDQSVGVMAGASRLGIAADRFLHGTTVATNALLERRGANTALITSPGFADVLEIGRQDRPSLYDSFADRPEPLIPRESRFEVKSPEDLNPAIGEASAVAVSLLYGYENSAAEAEIVSAVERRWPELAVSRSSEVALGTLRAQGKESPAPHQRHLPPRSP